MQDSAKLSIIRAVNFLISKERKGVIAVHTKEQAESGRTYLHNLGVGKEAELLRQKKKLPVIRFRVLHEDECSHTTVGTILSTS